MSVVLSVSGACRALEGAITSLDNASVPNLDLVPANIACIGCVLR